MRLTLRNLLAYMDGILEPEDAEDIRKKIEESEFATNLLHRIRDAMRRLRLAAPGVEDSRPGLDANTVAEYLDHTMHDDRVPDFEKVCLDSDICISEVASCHQILTLVLSEAAEVDPEARERMYRITNPQSQRVRELPPPPKADETPVGDAAAGESEPPKPRDKPTVPDYLREPREKRRLVPVAVGVVLVLCLAGIVLTATGQFRRDAALMRMLLGPEAEVADASDPAEPGSQPATAGQDPQPEDIETAARPGPADDLSAVPEAEDTATNSDAAAIEPAPAETGQTPEPGDQPEVGTEPDEGGAVPPEVPAEGADPAAGEPKPEADPAADLAPPPVVMGELLSEDQLLLRFDAKSGVWQRTPARAALLSGQPLVVPPTYHPRVSLGGVNLRLLGGTRIELLPGADDRPPGVKVDFGRLLIEPSEEAATRMRLVIGDRSGTITMAEKSTGAALEVSPVRVPGTDPEADPPLLAADLYTTAGRVLWNEDGADAAGQSLTIPAGQCLSLRVEPGQTSVAAKQVPKWLSEDTVSLLDRRASPVLQQSLDADRPAGLGLMELHDHRMKEVRWLAARCLGHIGQFGPMVVAINNTDQKLDWPEYIDQLRMAVWRSPQSAAEVRKAMEKHYPQDAKRLYRMLWGYSRDGLNGGDAAVLVASLDHETLAVRVLGFWNLKEITGWGLFYKPELTAAKRKQSVQKWNQRLKDGLIQVQPTGAKGTSVGPNGRIMGGS